MRCTRVTRVVVPYPHGRGRKVIPFDGERFRVVSLKILLLGSGKFCFSSR